MDRPRQALFATATLKTMELPTREVAEQLEIMPLLNELYNTETPATPERKAILREKIQETILESYFDAASVQAEADRETIRLGALRESLSSKRDRNVEINNATNFIASGALNTVGSILGFTNRLPPFPGNVNQMLSGVVSATMSTYALKQNSGGKIHSPATPTMLAEFFGRPVDERTTYPESVWRFLHGKSIDEPDKSRILVMENKWIEKGHLEPHGAKREKQKIDLVCGVGGKTRAMTLDDISDEISMIADIAAVTERLSHHLRDLQRMIDSDVLDPGK
ncbi:MAG: hypothetical protein JSS83_08450 [Cyanobacteria bacterium SZAS LIN-3]|nr:hypothetical protein [Cyanobacteria bacterium SZAS LIN-3]